MRKANRHFLYRFVRIPRLLDQIDGQYAGAASTTTTDARSTRPGMADHGRVMRCISFTAQLGRTWKCRAVACVYPRLVCGVIRTDL
jgi:hypothetical protein